MNPLTRPSILHSPANLIAIGAAAVAVLAATYTAVGRPHASGNASVAFVDVATVMAQSDAGKSINAQLAPKQQALQKEAQAKVDEQKQEQDELNKQQDSMPKEKIADANNALQQKLINWNTEAQKRDSALKAAAAPALQKIESVLRQQLATIAAENQFTAILPLQDAYYADKDLDVTSEAIRRLNAQLSKVDVKFEDKNQ